MCLESLPDYVVLDVSDIAASENTSIRIRSFPLQFPLSEEDQNDVTTLSKKFDSEPGDSMAGLAAPQIGIVKRIIIFSVPEGVAKFKRCQAYPKTILINPTYEPVNNEMHEEYEQCYSVKDFVGPVKRYKSIYYTGHDTYGKLIEGVAVGHPARVIQHEVDHLNGKLFIDLVPREKLMLFVDYMKMVASLQLRPEQSQFQ